MKKSGKRDSSTYATCTYTVIEYVPPPPPPPQEWETEEYKIKSKKNL